MNRVITVTIEIVVEAFCRVQHHGRRSSEIEMALLAGWWHVGMAAAVAVMIAMAAVVVQACALVTVAVLVRSLVVVIVVIIVLVIVRVTGLTSVRDKGWRHPRRRTQSCPCGQLEQQAEQESGLIGLLMLKFVRLMMPMLWVLVLIQGDTRHPSQRSSSG